MNSILERFALSGAPVVCEPYGNGHINETYRVICGNGDCYILQKINTRVFRDPVRLMCNIRLVTDHLKSRANSSREVLTLVPATDGASYVERSGEYWRAYEFVRDSICFERADTPEIFRESAATFGGFTNLLADFDASQLTETIPHFHDTPARFAAFTSAVATDAANRLSGVMAEVETAMQYEPFTHTLVDLQSAGALPLRVTHNDTKINNVLFDLKTRRGLCVVDLDTVMPGLIANDFGDSIRFGASTASEDEPDLDRVWLDLDLYEAYLSSYLATCGGSLTDLEKEMLPVGAKMMTYECGIRFLADYLAGDVYFHTRYPEHNLHRAHTQFKLVADMDAKWSSMQAILKGYMRK